LDQSKINLQDAGYQSGPAWNCQLFRSITSDSASFDPRRSRSLNAKKGRLVDSSIAQGYVKMIRNANNFIYIENQYFMGSAYAWKNENDTNCHHIIPAEIAQKVVDKIHSGQRFCAYILIPMFPEGDPTSAPIQVIFKRGSTPLFNSTKP
jgi:phospholipase D1/2